MNKFNLKFIINKNLLKNLQQQQQQQINPIKFHKLIIKLIVLFMLMNQYQNHQVLQQKHSYEILIHHLFNNICYGILIVYIVNEQILICLQFQINIIAFTIMFFSFIEILNRIQQEIYIENIILMKNQILLKNKQVKLS